MAGPAAAALLLTAAVPVEAATWQPLFDFSPRGPSRGLVQERYERPHFDRRPVRRTRKAPVQAKREIKPERKPAGPVTITISLAKQQLKIYDSDGLFAESRISSGKPGHSTPRGVFSVIQKHKWHRSNLYAGAPMPYMQRITWSGVALHAGIVPGYPASHGCVRLPAAFAVKLWHWTRMGARVVIAQDEIAPQDVTHPLLFAAKSEPKPEPAPAPGDVVPAAPADDHAAAPGDKAEILTDLRLSLDDSAHQAGDPREPAPVRTADASGKIVADGNVRSDTKPNDQADTKASAAKTQRADGAKAGPAADAHAVEPRHSAATTDNTASIAPPAGEAEPKNTEPKNAEPKDAEAKDGIKDAHGENAKDEVRADGAKADPDADAAEADAALALPPPPTDAGHVAMFISGKTQRLYVRRNFQPWFDVAVTIAKADEALGTHVFTARFAESGKSALIWRVVSLAKPAVPAKYKMVRRGGRRVRVEVEAAQPAAPPPSATGTLDRIAIPEQALARIAPLIGAGDSLIVSDKGLGPETGKGTDFIVLTR